MHRHGLIKIIDLEKDFVSVGIERTKVVFFVRVIGVAKVVVDLDGLDDRATASGPRAATPGVMTAMPPINR